MAIDGIASGNHQDGGRAKFDADGKLCSPAIAMAAAAPAPKMTGSMTGDVQMNALANAAGQATPTAPLAAENHRSRGTARE